CSAPAEPTLGSAYGSRGGALVVPSLPEYLRFLTALGSPTKGASGRWLSLGKLARLLTCHYAPIGPRERAALPVASMSWGTHGDRWYSVKCSSGTAATRRSRSGFGWPTTCSASASGGWWKPDSLRSARTRTPDAHATNTC